MMFDVIMKNWKRLCDENPDIYEAVKEGYEVGAYDEESNMIVCVELVDGSLKMKIVEDVYVIQRKEETK